ncbi:MAG: hypothetical protein RL120_19350, partial [Gammaproteobacteria bacterium]
QISRLLPLMLLLVPAPAWAQETSVEARIDETSATITALDGLAESCLLSLEADSAGLPTESCSLFLAAIDGEPVANYLSNCAALKQWRDAFIADRTVSDADAQTNLERLAGIEQNCGEEALSKRSEFVVSAFNRLARPGQDQAYRSLVQQSRQDRFDRDNRMQRDMLLRSVQQQRSRSDAAVQQQWNEIELELLRQQMRRDQ